jgi:replicative DNA helicase
VISETIPPKCLDIERAILASFLISRETFLKYSAQIKVSDFYSTDHAKVFSFMVDSLITDMVILADKFPQHAEMIAEIAGNSASSENLEYYIQTLQERAYRRRQLKALQLAQMQLCEDFDASALSIAENLMVELNPIEQKANKPQSIMEIMPDLYNQFKILQLGEGIKTGLVDVDRDFGVFMPGEYVLLAGRPSMGKTSLANQIARQAAKDGYPVLIFSLETLKNVMCGRIVFAETNTSYGKAIRGNFSELEAMTALSGKAMEFPIYLDDSPDITIGHIQSVSEAYTKRFGIKLIIIDHLGLIQVKGGRSRNEEISQISAGLKNIGLRLGVPIMPLCQLSRSVEMRNPPIPILSDLRDSGSLEQDADKVIFIYREEYYKRDSDKKGIAEIIIAKNKNGGTGYYNVIFDKETMNFKNLIKEEYDATRTEF